MTIHDIIHHLPTKPPQGLIDWAKTRVNVGEDYLIFRRESVNAPAEEVCCPHDVFLRMSSMVPKWGAVCRCTACGQEFETGWASNPRAGMRGIVVNLEENGMWSGWVDDKNDFAYTVQEGDSIPCPYCETEVKLVHKSSVGEGRTFQIMLGNVGKIGPYAVIYTWLYRRIIDANGREYSDFRPAKAYVVTEGGGLQQYNHVKQNSYGGTYDLPNWEKASRVSRDPFLELYYNYDAYNHKQVGGRMWTTMPVLDGTTAEKTGLEEYVLAEGDFPVAYLQEWKRHPYIENLMKAGYSRQVADDIDHQINAHIAYGNRSGRAELRWADLSKAKPKQQLSMSQREVVRLAGLWNVNMLVNWYLYCRFSGKMTATEYEAHRSAIGPLALEKLTAYAVDMEDKDWITDAATYVAKQKEPARAAEMLCDLWNMLNERGVPIDAVERWPHRLEETHDREIDRRKARKNAKIDLMFAKVAEKYADLEWTDGTLCVRLPRSNSELEREGKTLRHCVGSYGTRHTSESAVVFFVRHYRRPERSYYTMDYSFSQTGEWKRNQLHGYGNERHGKHKEHTHRIPPQVIAFVERWEREVLVPWYRKQLSAAKKKQKRSA